VMEKMGGKISVTSQVGIGSTFTLHVPIYKPELHAVEAAG
jgi:signal transduction histidine kinase